MNNTNYVYLAGPISDLSYDQATNWRFEVENKFPWWIHTLSPMRGKEGLRDLLNIKQSYEGSIMSNAKAINVRDYNDVKRSSAILVNFLGATKVSIGTVMEIAWAKVFGIPVVCVMEEGNPHEHIILEDACGFIVNDLRVGIDIIIQLLGDDNQVKDYNNPPKKAEPETVKGSDNDIDKKEESESNKKIVQKSFKELIEELIKQNKPVVKDLTNHPNPLYNPRNWTVRTGDAYPWYKDFYTIN